MMKDSYDANYQSGLSYLKLNLKEQAQACFMRSYQQLSPEHKTAQNTVYLGILSQLAAHAIEHSEREKSKTFIREGLKVKSSHADLLYLNALLLMDERRYDEMLEGIILYLISLGDPDAEASEYLYAHAGALEELFGNLLPTACKGAFEAAAIQSVVERLYKKTGNALLHKALEIMRIADHSRSEGEN